MSSPQMVNRRIAYLAPEIPARSSTFVYEELLALERMGVEVIPFSVHLPPHAETVFPDLHARTTYLYHRCGFVGLFLGWVSYYTRPNTLCKSLQALWHDVRSVSGARQKLALFYQFLVGGSLARDLLRHRCTHLHIHFAHVPCQIGMYASLSSGIPFTVTAHANDIFERGVLLKEKAQRAKKFLTVSEFNQTFLRGLGLPEEKLGLVRCGVSFDSPPVLPEGLNKTVYRLGSLGRLVEKKGFDVLLEAFACLIQREKEFSYELEIAGDGPLMDELLHSAQRFGLGGRVRFLGAMAHEQVKEWLAELDLFVLACRQDSHGDMDGIPVVLMEAMSQGIPVISTRISGIPELILEGKTGLLAAPGDVASLVEAIHRLTSDRELRCTVIRQAQSHVFSEFSQDLNVKRLMKCMNWDQHVAS